MDLSSETVSPTGLVDTRRYSACSFVEEMEHLPCKHTSYTSKIFHKFHCPGPSPGEEKCANVDSPSCSKSIKMCPSCESQKKTKGIYRSMGKFAVRYWCKKVLERNRSRMKTRIAGRIMRSMSKDSQTASQSDPGVISQFTPETNPSTTYTQDASPQQT